jgi:predicted PurR-regulated permease PerM
MAQKIEISYKTIIFAVFFLVFLWLVYQIREIIVGLFVSLVLMTAVNPSVDKLEKLKIPRLLGILLVYLIILVTIGLIIAGIVPPLIEQTATLVSRLPRYFEQLGFFNLSQGVIEDQISQLGSIPANLLKISLSIFSNLLSTFVILVITFYLLLERKNLNRYLHVLFAGDGQDRAERFITEIEQQLGGWVRAQLFLMIVIGLACYVGLRLLGIDFALPLALLAGLLEIIPNVGPTLAAVPAVLFGLIVSPIMALAVAALYFLIQQVENSFLVPQVMSQEVGVNPLITIISLAIGFKIGGVAGAVLAVPAVLLIKVITSEFFTSARFKNI